MRKILLLVVVLATFMSCFEDMDDNAVPNSSIKDFVWKGMNTVYLYKSDVPDLANDRFSTNEAYSNYLSDFDTPEELFEAIKYLPLEVDRFSRIVSNYFDLQNQLGGVTLNNGIEFNLYPLPGSDTEVFGAITLVLNNSVADNAGVVRGQLFRAVDGTNLTRTNFIELLFEQDSYTLNFADYDTNGTGEIADDTVILNGNSTALNQAVYTENPVHIAQTITLEDNTKVGYLMYNSFNNDFESQLNDAFGEFQSEGVTEFVLDLRYNGGGSIQTAAYLGSMLTGQFNGSVFSKTFYNDNLQNQNTEYVFENSIEGGGSINSLNLSKIYVLTTNRRTASASELVINSLRSYIDVVVIGENTVGKTQASTIVYDSPSLFSSQGANPGHTYAMLPLIANSTNVNDVLVPSNGIVPDIGLSEVSYNLGTLGDVNEPLLAAAIDDILGDSRPNFQILRNNSIKIPVSVFEQEMFID